MVHKYTDPTNSQDQQQVEAYYRNVKPGDPAVIRCTQGNCIEFKLDRIAEGSPKRGRVYLEQGDAWGGRAWYAKHGKSCFHPGSQSNLVVPTEEVMAWMRDHPNPVSANEVDHYYVPPGQRDGSRTDSFAPERSSVMLARLTARLNKEK